MIEAADTEVDLTMCKQLLVDAEGKELRGSGKESTRHKL